MSDQKTENTVQENKNSRIIHIEDRSQIPSAERIVIKAGSAVISDQASPNRISLSRITSLAEQIINLKQLGKKVLLVCSGAVAVGSRILDNEEMISTNDFHSLGQKFKINEDLFQKKVSASIGQSNITSAFGDVFSKFGFEIAQILVTVDDFFSPRKRYVLGRVLYELSESSSVIPVINTNDAVSPPCDSNKDLYLGLGVTLKDNDNLAALIAKDVSADLLIILSNVDGVYTGDPQDSHSMFIRTFTEPDLGRIQFSQDTLSIGTGGMESKARSALWSVKNGCNVVIANGCSLNENKVIDNIMEGHLVGTFFTEKPDRISLFDTAERVKLAQRRLECLSFDQLADLLEKNKAKILEENAKDVEIAEKNKDKLIGRLKITEEKLQDLVKGIRQLTIINDPLNKIISQKLIDNDLFLKKVTVSLGVLLVICESRPDVPPQVAALSIASGNGLHIKGGKEAAYSNKYIGKLIKEALSINGCEDSFSMLTTRSEVSEMLEMPQYVDLVIPRGSNQLVRSIQKQCRTIPVLGHSEGICHVYVDKNLEDVEKAIRIIIDSKCDYPTACNAMETLLVHEDLAINQLDKFKKIMNNLKDHNVQIFSGPKFKKSAQGEEFVLCSGQSVEYSSKACTVELVKDVNEAADYINLYGSHHTDSIITSDIETANYFTSAVDSASVFHNASTRFADGYRFGLGAEVGISTTKIHARGPVGIEGLLSTKFILVGDGNVAADYKTGGPKTYKHTDIDIRYNLDNSKKALKMLNGALENL